MKGIFDFFTTLLGKFAQFAEWLILVIKRIFLDAFVFIQDCVCWVFESCLSVAIGALNLIEVPFDPSTYYSMIPPEISGVLGYIGIPQAFSIIVAALLIRFLLQTIPFVRWGS